MPESRSTKSEGVVEGPKPEIDSLRPEGSSSETPGPAAAAVVSEQEPVVAQPSTASARRETTPTPTETPTPAEESAPYRGSGILVLTWSESGDPSAAAAAETALLDELRSRDVEVADPTVLQLLSEDPGARVAARTGDVEALAALAREHGAAVLLTGSLRTQAEPSVGGFFTGTAILDVHAYRIADAQLLKAETYQVGSGDTPGKLGSTALAAETEAAKAVGTQAAVSLGAELSPNRSSP